MVHFRAAESISVHAWMPVTITELITYKTCYEFVALARNEKCLKLVHV